MQFKQALKEVCKSGASESFAVYCALADLVKSDYTERAKVVLFYAVDKRLKLVSALREGGESAVSSLYAAYPAVKDLLGRERYDGLVECVAESLGVKCTRRKRRRELSDVLRTETVSRYSQSVQLSVKFVQGEIVRGMVADEQGKGGGIVNKSAEQWCKVALCVAAACLVCACGGLSLYLFFGGELSRYVRWAFAPVLTMLFAVGIAGAVYAAKSTALSGREHVVLFVCALLLSAGSIALRFIFSGQTQIVFLWLAGLCAACFLAVACIAWFDERGRAWSVAGTAGFVLASFSILCSSFIEVCILG